MNRLPILFCAAAALSTLAGSARADVKFDRKAVVERVAELVDELYVDPKTGKALAEHLRKKLAQGAFDSCSAPSDLGDALTRALREVADDKHLSVRFGASAAAGGPVRIVRGGPGPGGHGPAPPAERRIVAGPNERPAEGPDRAPARSNVARVERLDGNVGYLALSGFSPSDRNREAMTSAMSLLDDADAIIVDVGQCPGGAPSAVVFLESYFFGPEPKELMARYDRPTDRTEHEFTLKELPGKRRTEVPLWIVAGPDTASACESFAYTLQQYGRAAVVGARTAGAGYNNVMVPAGEGFTLSVSVAKPMHPKTGGGWEGTGVTPDVVAAPGRALAAAHREALNALISKASPDRRTALEWALEAQEAGAGKVTAPLGAYAGNYGAREITAAESGLFYRNAGGRLAGPFVPVARDRFLFRDQLRLNFERGSDGAVSALSLERPDGTRERTEKGVAGTAAGEPCAKN
jgi:retinol-binding protein 3